MPMPLQEILIGGGAAFLMGTSKAGLKGTGIVIVALMVFAYGAKASTGVLLPLLILADVFAVIYYNKHAQWSILIKFLPWMVIGVLVGVYVGQEIDDRLFKKLMSIIIFASVILMFWWERGRKQIPQNRLLAATSGLLAGFTTMIGNLAGPLVNIYFLAMRIPKDQFIGTAAWLFFIINIFKVPFHVFSWKTINTSSLLADLYLVPFVVVGFFVGVKIVSMINEKAYRYFILIVTALTALILLFR